MTRHESESRRITRTHNEWLAKRGLPAGNRFNRFNTKAKTDDKTNRSTGRNGTGDGTLADG